MGFRRMRKRWRVEKTVRGLYKAGGRVAETRTAQMDRLYYTWVLIKTRPAEPKVVALDFAPGL